MNLCFRAKIKIAFIPVNPTFPYLKCGFSRCSLQRLVKGMNVSSLRIPFPFCKRSDTWEDHFLLSTKGNLVT